MADYSHLMGWNDNPKEVERIMSTLPFPSVASCIAGIEGSGRGKTVLLYKFFKMATGQDLIDRLQVGPDCVSMGSALGVDIIKVVQHVLNKTLEEFTGYTATEPIYGGSRVAIGGGQLGYGGGSNGIWAAKYVQQYGTVVRKKYGNIDLSIYDYSKAEQWGRPRVGVPKELEIVSKEHKVLTISQVSTFYELMDCVNNGYPITIASSRGFNTTRDKDGCLRPQGSWPHQMCIIGAKDDNRPGALIENSWGRDWVNGPKGEFDDMPDGSFWVDAQVLERDILSAGDSWAYSNFEGYPPQDLDLRPF